MEAVRLVLVRHGESEWNAAGILQGHGGPGLTARGREQAAVTARLLHRDHAAAAVVVCSDLPRVAETAAPAQELLPQVPVRIDERLREIDLGSWTGLTRAQAAAADPELYRAWRRGEDVAPGHGETFTALRGRVVEALADVADGVLRDGGRGQVTTVLVFTHGGPIRVAVAAGLGLPAGGHRSVRPVGNCAVGVLEVPGPGALVEGRALLGAYNRVEHLVDGRRGMTP